MYFSFFFLPSPLAVHFVFYKVSFSHRLEGAAPSYWCLKLIHKHFFRVQLIAMQVYNMVIRMRDLSLVLKQKYFLQANCKYRSSFIYFHLSWEWEEYFRIMLVGTWDDGRELIKYISFDLYILDFWFVLRSNDSVHCIHYTSLSFNVTYQEKTLKICFLPRYRITCPVNVMPCNKHCISA